ncbi:MAG: prepilin-type N-terminal cleavage/methylation domain-containing protein [Pseudomonadota bacterium]
MKINQTIKNNNYGFTLVELMITVVIIGILAGLATTAYNRYILKSKKSEIPAAFGTIKAGEESYHVEYGQYLPLPRNPTNLPHGEKLKFTYVTNKPDNPDNYDSWGPGGVAVRPDYDVYFRYVVEAGVAGCPLSTGDGSGACSEPTGSGLFIDRTAAQLDAYDSDGWYVVQAVGDLNADVAGDNCTLADPDPGSNNCAFFETIYDRTSITEVSPLK